MVPFEFRELMDQIEKLWTQGFISPYILISDEPALLVQKDNNCTRQCLYYAQTKDDARDRQNSEDHHGNY